MKHDLAYSARRKKVHKSTIEKLHGAQRLGKTYRFFPQRFHPALSQLEFDACCQGREFLSIKGKIIESDYF